METLETADLNHVPITLNLLRIWSLIKMNSFVQFRVIHAINQLTYSIPMYSRHPRKSCVGLNCVVYISSPSSMTGVALDMTWYDEKHSQCYLWLAHGEPWHQAVPQQGQKPVSFSYSYIFMLRHLFERIWEVPADLWWLHMTRKWYKAASTPAEPLAQNIKFSRWESNNHANVWVFMTHHTTTRPPISLMRHVTAVWNKISKWRMWS